MAEVNNSENTNKKSWFARHKVLTVILAFILLMGVVTAASGGDDTSTSGSTEENSNKEYRFNDRADKQGTDVEVLPGETATIEGVKMTLTNPTFKTSLNEFEEASSGKTYLVADVAIENTSDRTQPYNVFDFRVQTAGGQVLDGAIVSEESLSSGDLVSGGRVEGKVYFEVPVEAESQYVIWKPGLGSERAIVQVSQE